MTYLKKLKQLLTVKALSLLLLCILFQASHAFAKPLIEIPDSVKQGNAVIVNFSDDEPNYDKVFIYWLDMKIPLYLEKDGEAVKGKILLAMPTDDTKSRKIRVEYGENSFSKNIKPIIVDWRKTTLTVEQKYLTPPKEVQDQIDANREKNGKVYASRTMMNTLKFPLTRSIDSKITSEFGVKRVYNGSTKSVHRGTDYRAAVGAKLHAVADGIVKVAELQYYSGNMVMIDHGQGIISMYGHMSELGVKEGQEVKAGQFIGYAGATGRVSGPHLHLSLILQGYSVDVEPLLAPSKMKVATKKAVKKPVKQTAKKQTAVKKQEQVEVKKHVEPIRFSAPSIDLKPRKSEVKQ